MKYNKVTEELVEIKYDEDKDAKILDCTKEIEEAMKELLPEN